MRVHDSQEIKKVKVCVILLPPQDYTLLNVKVQLSILSTGRKYVKIVVSLALFLEG